MNCKYYDSVRNDCGSGKRESWECVEDCGVDEPWEKPTPEQAEEAGLAG